MMDLFNGMSAAELAQATYRSNPAIDPTPILSKMDSWVPPAQRAYGLGLTAGGGTGLQMPQSGQVGLGNRTAAGQLSAMGGPQGNPAAAWASLLGGAKGMFTPHAAPEPAPDPGGVPPGGQAAKLLVGLPPAVQAPNMDIGQLLARAQSAGITLPQLYAGGLGR